MIMVTPKKHLEFIRLVVEGTNQSEAYKLTCGNKSLTSQSAKVKGSQLAKKYKNEIQLERQKRSDMVTAAKDTEVVKNALNEVLSQAQVDAKLSKIINGDLIEITALNAFGKVFTNEVTPTISQVLGAIDLYNKRFGSNAPIKKDITSNGEKLPTPTIVKLSNGTEINLA